MEKYSRVQIEQFLIAIDKNLKKSFHLVIIGGTAAALAYRVTEYTKDIDTIGSVASIEAAYKAAIAQTGFKIPLGPAGVEDGPFDLESRLIKLSIKGLKKLSVSVPEKHDLVLMKMIRGYEHDFQVIEQIHANEILNFQVLLERMQSEMTQVIGNKKNILENFFALIELLFGEVELKTSKKALRDWVNR